VESGLKTLAQAQAIPYTLTLAEAAAADQANLEQVLANLRAFFAKRQPRRRRRA